MPNLRDDVLGRAGKKQDSWEGEIERLIGPIILSSGCICGHEVVPKIRLLMEG